MGLLEIMKNALVSKPAVLRDASTEENKIVTNDDMKQFENIGYHFSSPLFYFSNTYCMLIESEQNKNKVFKDIDFLNTLLRDASRLAGLKSNLYIKKENIKFARELRTLRSEKYFQYYSLLECSPYTATGKTAKFPITLYFADKNCDDTGRKSDFHGRIHYMCDGNIGKADITIGDARKGYEIAVRLKGLTLSISRITEFDSFEKKILYKEKD